MQINSLEAILTDERIYGGLPAEEVLDHSHAVLRATRGQDSLSIQTTEFLIENALLLELREHVARVDLGPQVAVVCSLVPSEDMAKAGGWVSLLQLF